MYSFRGLTNWFSLICLREATVWADILVKGSQLLKVNGQCSKNYGSPTCKHVESCTKHGKPTRIKHSVKSLNDGDTLGIEYLSVTSSNFRFCISAFSWPYFSRTWWKKTQTTNLHKSVNGGPRYDRMNTKLAPSNAVWIGLVHINCYRNQVNLHWFQ